MKHLLIAKKIALISLILISQAFLSSSQAFSNSEKKKFLSYKNFIDKTISRERINRNLRYFTAEPHVASSPRNNELANFILKEWKTYGLDEVRLAQYDVLLSFPKKIIVEMVSPD